MRSTSLRSEAKIRERREKRKAARDGQIFFDNLVQESSSQIHTYAPESPYGALT